MFRKTEKERPQGFWDGNEQGLSGKRRAFYEEKSAWHNQFRREVTNRVDESVFEALYSEGTGRPNAAVRVLVAMMALKEGKGISDSELFEQTNYNMLVRSAVGLINIDDEAPVASTYYLFRKMIYDYEVEHGENLLDKAFCGITQEQCFDFGVKGKKIRMDSKLLGSNIAWLCRYQIVHETVRKYIKGAGIGGQNLNEWEKALLKEIIEEEGNAVTYRCTKEEVNERFQRLGVLVHSLLRQDGACGTGGYEMLKRVFDDNYEVVKKEVKALEKAKISAKSVQNPHDTDAQYRNKNGQQIKGYSINVTETCDEGSLNLITDVRTEGAGTSDVHFFQEAIDRTQKVVREKIEQVHTDGGFHSPENQNYCADEKRNIDFILGRISGKPTKYDLSFDEAGELVALNRESGERLEAVRTKRRDGTESDRWRIKDGNNAPLYFDRENVIICALRKKIQSLSKDTLNIRNNVEATILQLGYHFRHDKSKYRGIIKHRMWALSRCMWINFRRIANWLAPESDKGAIQYAV
jgi:hypothetical protein